MDDLKTFRQLHSRCAGHPEYHWTSGVETTTGPLGNGLATSVGMAIASKWLGATYNKPGYELFDFSVYALAGDGCFQEGVQAEAASLAGHLQLDNLCWIWDNNHISIEGNTDWSFTEDVATRFVAYGWNITRVTDANDLPKLQHAFNFCFGQTLVVGSNRNVLGLACALLRGRNMDQSIGVHSKCNLNLRDTTRSRWNARQSEATQQVVVLCHGPFALKDLNSHSGLVVSLGRKGFCIGEDERGKNTTTHPSL